MECTFRPLLFLHRRPFSCLRRTWWDGVKEDVWRGRVKGKLANPGSSSDVVKDLKFEDKDLWSEDKDKELWSEVKDKDLWSEDKDKDLRLEDKDLWFEDKDKDLRSEDKDKDL